MKKSIAITAIISASLLIGGNSYAQTGQCRRDGMGFCGDRREFLNLPATCRQDQVPFKCTASRIDVWYYGNAIRGIYLRNIENKETGDFYMSDMGSVRRPDGSTCFGGSAVIGNPEEPGIGRDSSLPIQNILEVQKKRYTWADGTRMKAINDLYVCTILP